MIKSKNHITVFEHESIRQNQVIDSVTISKKHIEALEQFYGNDRIPYYSLINKGVKFCEYVGVIQVGSLTINVLPKADKQNSKESTSEQKESWSKVLVGMLQAVGIFNIQAPSSSLLQLKTNSILDLYFELFVKELEYLIHRGLIKKYRKTEGNNTALKGSIQFAQHIRDNLVHQERFYIRHSTYDRHHLLHFILYKALKLVHRINTNTTLNSRLGALLMDFPEMPDIKVSDALFEQIQLDRKTESYKTALDIARLILMNYHPDISRGQNDVLALMFDMNLLWEQFVYVSLQKQKENGTSIIAQNVKNFWKPESGHNSKMKPDIVIRRNGDCMVLDTKWKNLNGKNPSPEDLRQMYVYSNYYNATRVALVYPGNETSHTRGNYYQEAQNTLSEKVCGIISIKVNPNIKELQKEIEEVVFENIL